MCASVNGRADKHLSPSFSQSLRPSPLHYISTQGESNTMKGRERIQNLTIHPQVPLWQTKSVSSWTELCSADLVDCTHRCVAFSSLCKHTKDICIHVPIYKVLPIDDNKCSRKTWVDSYYTWLNTFCTANETFSFSAWRRQRPQKRNSHSRLVLSFLCSVCWSNWP